MSNVVGLDLESLGWLESSIRDLIVLVVREMHSTSGDEKRSGETSEVKVFRIFERRDKEGSFFYRRARIDES